MAAAGLVTNLVVLASRTGNPETPAGCVTTQHVLQDKESTPDPALEIRKLEAEIRINQRDASLREQLAVLLYGTGREQEAISQLQAAITIAPQNPWYHYMLADIYRSSGRMGEALREAQLAADLGTKSTEQREATPLYSLSAAQMLHRSRRYGQAEEYYELTLAQLSAFASEWKAMCIGKNGSARDNMCRMLTWLPKREIRLDAQGQHQDLYSALRQVAQTGLKVAKTNLINSRPSFDWIRGQLPYLDIPVASDAQPDAKCKDLEAKVLGGLLGGEGAHMDLGACYLRSGNADEAAIEFLAATQLSPQSPAAWFNLGIAYLCQGRLQAAEKAFEKACQLGDKGSDTLASAARRLRATFAQKSKRASAR